MTTTHSIDRRPVRACISLAMGLALMAGQASAQLLSPAGSGGLLGAPRAGAKPPARNGDFIVAIVNNELVTAAEVDQRVNEAQANAARTRGQLPPMDQLRQQVLDGLINERVLVTYARENSNRIDEAEVDRAVANVAAQNQISTDVLRERLAKEGTDMVRFRSYLRDQMMLERVREREVQGRIKISEFEIDDYLAKQAKQAADYRYDIAHVLVAVPEGATPSQVAERQAKARALLDRVRAGEDFARVAASSSDDTGSRAAGGRIGVRSKERIPELFFEAVKDLPAGSVAPQLVRSPAGFHVVKLVDKSGVTPGTVTQTRARHILLRPSAQLTPEAAVARLQGFKRDIQSGRKRFEDLAKSNSEDGSAEQGGDLGWVNPGAFVPEFETAMAALPINGLSEPVFSRFGIHLIQVVERRDFKLDPKQQREQAKNALREQKFEQSYDDWVRDLRARAYIEMRDSPQ